MVAFKTKGKLSIKLKIKAIIIKSIAFAFLISFVLKFLNFIRFDWKQSY